jgi:glycogen operon protein
MKNLASVLLLSQGVPMILGGDEMGRTQRGNNNPYCQDNEISWFNWDLLKTHRDLFRFFKLLIAFRKQHPILRRRTYQSRDETTPAFLWHGIKPGEPDWGWHSRFLGLQLTGGDADNDILILANAFEGRLKVELARPSRQPKWYRFVDTSLTPPHEICETGKLRTLARQSEYDVAARSVVVLVSG